MKERATNSHEPAGRPSARLMTRRAFIGTAALGMTTGLALGANSFTEPFLLDRSLVRVPIVGLPREFSGYRIGQLSDLHYPRNMTADFIRNAVSALDVMQVDLLVITGDLVDKKGGDGPRGLANMFDHCAAPDGILAVLGNHDHWYDAEAVRADVAGNTPVRLIDHEHFLINRGGAQLAIGGVGDLWTDTVDLRATFRGLSPDVPRILLSHNPDVAELKADDGVRVDLQLSGHTHGGEVTLPFLGPLTIPSRHGRKYARGLNSGPSWPVYTNRGLCSPRFIRFGCRPEVTCVELVAA